MAVGAGHVARALEPVRRVPKEWVAGLRLVALSLECVEAAFVFFGIRAGCWSGSRRITHQPAVIGVERLARHVGSRPKPLSANVLMLRKSACSVLEPVPVV